uniref:Uncharacterized protein n=1 Tax=Ixodes ricinus TaxID=34613 RepID=A0A6B0UIT5_IXORI
MIKGKQKLLTMPVIAWESPVLRIAINIVRHISGKWREMPATFPEEKNRRQSGVTEKRQVNLNIFIKKTAKAVHIQVKLKRKKRVSNKWEPKIQNLSYDAQGTDIWGFVQ